MVVVVVASVRANCILLICCWPHVLSSVLLIKLLFVHLSMYVMLVLSAKDSMCADC